ncbi:hypothetical protein [Clostridium sp.]|uniref:alginate O-acetyltransferase AlgX-related protein n=1 Tax=Clostridium sp. TaxID=1506 RepID=UPI002FCB1E71
MESKTSKILAQTRNLVILTLIFFGIIAGIYNEASKNVVKLNISSKTSKNNTYQVFYTNKVNSLFNEEMIINAAVKPSKEFQDIKFKIPSREIDKLRIDFGVKPEEVIIENITLEHRLKKVVLSPAKILEVFSKVGEHVEKIEVKDNLLYIISQKEDPLIYGENTATLLEQGEINKDLMITIAIIAITFAAISLWIYGFIKRKGLSIRKLGFISVFMIAIFLPSTLNAVGIQVGENTEQRQLAKKPSFKLDIETIKSYPKNYENYLNDNFGLKNLLVKWNSYLNVKLLNQSPSQKVTVGEEGWLYYTQEGNENLIDVYRGAILFKEEELLKIKENLEERRDWLQSQGIPFVITVTPNKETIYGEYLPNNIKKVSEETRLDQLLSYLEKNSDIEIVDIRQKLLDKKNEERLYDKTDSHWNEYGAYIGYSAIMEEVNEYFPEIKPKEFQDFNVEKKWINEGGDLAKLIGIPKSFAEEHIILTPKASRKAIPVGGYTYKLAQGTVMDTADKSLPKLLMFRDSFTVRLLPLISEHFSTSIYQWSHTFDEKLILQTKPDIVIHQITERFIGELLRENPKAIKK